MSVSVVSQLTTKAVSATVVEWVMKNRVPAGYFGLTIGSPIDKTPKYTYRFLITSKVQGIVWSSLLQDKKSSEFAEAHTKYCKAWNMTEKSDFKGCTVTDFYLSNSSRTKRSTDSLKSLVKKILFFWVTKF